MPTLAELYGQLAIVRQPYLERARDNASLTLPTLFPEESFGGSDEFDDPYQSIGAQGANSLTSKLLLTLFPPGLRFFEYQLDPLAVAQALESDDGASVDAARRDAETRAATLQFHVETETFRVRAKEAIENLVVGGSVLLDRMKEGGYRLWRLPSYVVDFDAADNLLAVVTTETIRRSAAPPEVRAAANPATNEDEDDSLTIFSGWVRRPGTKTFDAYQEVDGNRIEGTDAEYPLDKLPIHPARFDPCCGAPYGRSLVERLIGDLASLEGLTQAGVELAAEAARLVWMIREGSTVTPERLSATPNGGHMHGNPEDVKALQVDKLQDIRVVAEMRASLREDLKRSFHMLDSIQRDAERVTALEVQTLARELDTTLGGVYSGLALELQTPVLRMEEAALVRAGILNDLSNDGSIKRKIVAGIEGLGRGIEFQQLQRFLQSLALVPVEQATNYQLDTRLVFEMLAKSSGVSLNILRKPDEATKMSNAAQQQAALQNVAPELTRQIGGAVRERLAPTNGASQ
jgi:hypothetical protein